MTVPDISLRQRLETDLKEAMRAKDVTARESIRFVLAAIKNAEIDKGGPLNRDEDLVILQRQVKLRHEAIEQAEAAGRLELVEQDRAQLTIIERYLPAQLDDAELRAVAVTVVDEVGATGLKDMGKVMPTLLKRLEGRADGKRVSDTVRELLQTE